ncbi:MAG: TIGR01777 family protein [Deltaproteobacteria bacterium]|nr:MAG: TIGR01777 family protein [Deltaproteobacteria bacterium]TMA51736.1 MAG: TIGR01777 family protein [Deltaproteobacteria bacterium]
MRVLVTGGTGFIGRAVCHALRGAGHTVTIVSRDASGEASGDTIGWEAVGQGAAAADAVVNLAGEPIAGGRWSPARKEAILESRVGATRALVDAVGLATTRPKVLISASAVGYYGARDDEPLDETAGAGSGFLAEVCQAWEGEASRAEAFGLRVVRLRFGMVLAGDGGALARMLPPFRAFVGGPLGDGQQWTSWIHRGDVTGLVLAALVNEGYRGAINATAPEPVRNRDFTAALGRVLVRPAAIRVPAMVLRLALGEMADVLLTGQRVLPRAAERLGYRWQYPEVLGALRASVR